MAVWISTRPEIHTDFLDSDNQEAHITLVYLKAANFEDTLNILRNRTKPISMNCEINGFGTWIIPDGYVQYACVASREQELHLWQKGLAAHFREQADQTYPFTPHITLGYSDEPYTTVPWLGDPFPFKVNNLFVSEDNFHQMVWSTTSDGVVSR